MSTTRPGGPDLSPAINTNDANEPQSSVTFPYGIGRLPHLTPEYGIDSPLLGGLSPVALTYTLENHSGADISWTAGADTDLVTVTPSSEAGGRRIRAGVGT